MTVTPAYGRDYSSAKAARMDWQKGNDFIIRDVTSRWDGKPCSIRDGLEDVWIRYDKLRKKVQA